MAQWRVVAWGLGKRLNLAQFQFSFLNPKLNHFQDTGIEAILAGRFQFLNLRPDLRSLGQLRSCPPVYATVQNSQSPLSAENPNERIRFPDFPFGRRFGEGLSLS
jgi:hypothetical protein